MAHDNSMPIFTVVAYQQGMLIDHDNRTPIRPAALDGLVDILRLKTCVNINGK